MRSDYIKFRSIKEKEEKFDKEVSYQTELLNNTFTKLMDFSEVAGTDINLVGDLYYEDRDSQCILSGLTMRLTRIDSGDEFIDLHNPEGTQLVTYKGLVPDRYFDDKEFFLTCSVVPVKNYPTGRIKDFIYILEKDIENVESMLGPLVDAERRRGNSDFSASKIEPFVSTKYGVSVLVADILEGEELEPLSMKNYLDDEGDETYLGILNSMDEVETAIKNTEDGEKKENLEYILNKLSSLMITYVTYRVKKRVLNDLKSSAFLDIIDVRTEEKSEYRLYENVADMFDINKASDKTDPFSSMYEFVKTYRSISGIDLGTPALLSAVTVARSVNLVDKELVRNELDEIYSPYVNKLYDIFESLRNSISRKDVVEIDVNEHVSDFVMKDKN